MEKPRTMLNKSRTAAFHSIFTVLRSELWYLERIEPHKSCWGLANKNLSYKGGSVNGTLLEKGKIIMHIYEKNSQIQQKSALALNVCCPRRGLPG